MYIPQHHKYILHICIYTYCYRTIIYLRVVMVASYHTTLLWTSSCIPYIVYNSNSLEQVHSFVFVTQDIWDQMMNMKINQNFPIFRWVCINIENGNGCVRLHCCSSTWRGLYSVCAALKPKIRKCRKWSWI